MMIDKIIIAGKSFNTLVAITEEDHIKGLMFRQPPAPVMVFPYNKAEVRKFWMRNTIAPLDIIFCQANRIIEIHDGVPLSLRHVGPAEPTDLVIEMPQGTAKVLAIAPGHHVKLERSVRTVAAMFIEALRKNANC